MSVTPPDTMKVGPHTYDLHFVHSVDVAVHGDAEGKVAEADRQDMFGHINHKEGTLYIGLDMNGSQQRDTLIHEMMHALLMQIGHDEELLVHRIAPLLLSFMQGNPQLVEFIMDRKFR